MCKMCYNESASKLDFVNARGNKQTVELSMNVMPEPIGEM